MIDGEFENTCQNVEFTPDGSVTAIMTTPVGNYKLLQFHFHWGANSGEGAEHLVDGNAEEFEAHFVYEKAGGMNASAGDAIAVLAVRGKVSSRSIVGIFAELDASQITEVDEKITVEDIIMTDLFPKNHDYYYYEGSLTTHIKKCVL
jgi:carbonic anhydrase